MTDGRGPQRASDADADDEVAERLRRAPFEPVARFADASNATLLVRLTDRDPRTLAELAEELGRDPTLDDLDPADLAVHKPRRGEAPLWDFPSGTLHLREVAAYEVSAALGWGLVPVTVLRMEGPLGEGSLQRFVAHDPAEHYFHLLEHGSDEVVDQLRAMVVLDTIIDNADRKGGHVLLERDEAASATTDTGRVKLVDHGVSFNVEHKLRTVGWHFAGEPVPAGRREDARRLAAELEGGPVADRLARLLAPEELAVLCDRVAHVAELEVFPGPSGRHPFPWPLL